MRRIVIQLVIISLLSINAAWAMDDCVWQFSNASPVLENPDSGADNQQDQSICDLPCVGWLHLVAIMPDSKFDYYLPSHQGGVRNDYSFHSLDQAPPVRPPQL